MMKNWQTKTLGEVCEVIAGQSPEGKFYNRKGSGLPFYQGKKEFAEKYLGVPTTWTTYITKEAHRNDILMSVRAPVGPTNIATERICIGRGLAAIRAKGIDREFLFNFLRHFESEIIGSEGAVFNSINKAQIEEIDIPVPPLPEQHRIVAILDNVFELIAKAKANAEKNLQNARELFESYLQEIFFSSEQTETSLEELCELIIDCEHKTAPILPERDSEFYSVRTPNIGKGELILTTANRVSQSTYREWTRRSVPQAGDLILGREAPAGNIAMIPEGAKVCLGQRTVLLRTYRDRLRPQYLVHLVLSKNIQERLLHHSRGATVAHVNMKDIRALRMPYLPNTNEQDAIVNRLESLSSQIKKLEAIYKQKLADLEELKKSVLRRAFSGEL